jgi:hypothetical protein
VKKNCGKRCSNCKNNERGNDVVKSKNVILAGLKVELPKYERILIIN